MGALPTRVTESAAAPETMTLGHALDGLASELERSRVVGMRIEGVICSLAVREGLASDVIGELQSYDALLQHIAALRDFAHALAEVAGREHTIPCRHALDQITLADCRARLAGFADDGDHSAWEML
jgi:hypothetical protein